MRVRKTRQSSLWYALKTLTNFTRPSIESIGKSRAHAA